MSAGQIKELAIDLLVEYAEVQPVAPGDTAMVTLFPDHTNEVLAYGEGPNKQAALLDLRTKLEEVIQ